MERSSVTLAAWLVVGAATAGAIALVPAVPFLHLANPSYFAVVAYVVTLGVMASQQVPALRRPRLERSWFMGFLVGMPLIYLADWTRFGEGGGWLAVELAGLAVFGGVALASRRRRVWLLAVGIGAHGLWDLAHYRSSSSIPDWYTLACALIDFAIAFYVAARIPLWRRERAERR